MEFVLVCTLHTAHCTLHLPDSVNKSAELPLPYMIWFFCLRQWAAIRRSLFFTLDLFLKWLFVDWGGGRYKERACRFNSSQSVLEYQREKNQSFNCKISTNYEQPRQSVARILIIKSWWKRREASNSSCIFLEKDTCLRRATKIVATEVGQVKQTVTANYDHLGINVNKTL